jgi:hypothetical protein
MSSKTGSAGALGDSQQNQEQISELQGQLTAEQAAKKDELEKLRIKLARQRGTSALGQINVPDQTLGG